MTSVPKDVYKTIKRSISATTNGLINNSQQLFGNGSSNNRFSNFSNVTTTKHWIHPPDAIINGVEYTAKMWGKIEVAEPKGSHVVRDAIHAIRFQHQLNKSVASISKAKLRKVDLLISINGLNILDSKSRAILFKHSLRRISFCADDKEDKRVFSFIAKTDDDKHECFVFTSEKMAEKITLTIGEAFDLAYERYCRKSGRDLENQKKIILLKKRVGELESENALLKQQLGIVQNDGSLPTIPNTPIPPAPINATVQLTNTNNQNNNNNLNNLQLTQQQQQQQQQSIALAPPPTQNSRRINGLDNKKSEPYVGRRLQNLQIDKMEDLFDDEFDPRAGEKKSAENKNNHNGGSNETVEDLEELLIRIDERLAEIKEGFSGESLERGDTGDSGRDLI